LSSILKRNQILFVGFFHTTLFCYNWLRFSLFLNTPLNLREGERKKTFIREYLQITVEILFLYNNQNSRSLFFFLNSQTQKAMNFIILMIHIIFRIVKY
jgi:hypothetical protein